VIGLAQWLVLRQRLPIQAWWGVITAAGMALGLAIAVALFGIDTTGNALPLRGLVTGAGIGLAQYMLLRTYTRRAAVWPVVVALGWALGWLVTRAVGVDLGPNFTVFGAAGAITFQVVSGLVLAWILADR
jgi:hypothetical protein